MSKLTKKTRADSRLAIHGARGRLRGTAPGLRRAWSAVLDACESAPRRVSVAIVDDATMSQMHLDYSKIPGTTDVLSFDLRDGAGVFDAEIVICADVASRESEKRKLPFERELQLYLVHGMLHLSGHDDHAPRDRARMRAAERKILKMAGWDAPARARRQFRKNK